MMPIKTKEFASLLVAAVAAIVVAAAMWLLEAVWWQTPLRGLRRVCWYDVTDVVYYSQVRGL